MGQTESLNWLFFCRIIWIFVQSVLLSNLLYRVDMALCSIILYVSSYIPVIFYIRVKNISVCEWIPFQKLKVPILFCSVIAGVLLIFVSLFFNTLSTLFMTDIDMMEYNLIHETPMWINIFYMGLLGPFAEELLVRGIYYHTYKADGVISGMIGSSILFTVLHWNFRQLISTFVVGVVLCLLVEVTESIYASFIAHTVFNSMLVISNHMNGSREVGMGKSFIAVGDLLKTGALAFFSIVLLAALIFWLIKYYKKENYIKQCLKYNGVSKGIKTYFAFVTPIYVITVVFTLAFMFFSQII